MAGFQSGYLIICPPHLVPKWKREVEHDGARRPRRHLGAAAAYMAGFQRILIICPPHLTRKWKRELEQTVPFARAAIVTSITDLERLRLSIGSGPLFAVMSREKRQAVLPLDARRDLQLVPSPAVSRTRRQGSCGRRRRVSPSASPAAPTARRRSSDKDGVPLTVRRPEPQEAHLRRLRRSPLWQADRSGPARYPLWPTTSSTG